MKSNHSRLIFAFFALAFSFILPAAEISSEWTIFGPYYRLMHRLPDGLASTIPQKLKVGSQTASAVTARHADGKLDIAATIGKKIPHRAFYVCIPIQASRDESLVIGAGADWYMDIYLNGKPVGDTLMEGNVAWPPTSNDHKFTLDLKKGRNLLVIGVIGGTGSQQLLLQPNPKFPQGYPLEAKAQFGQEQMPPLSAIESQWQKGNGKECFQTGEYQLANETLKLSPKIGKDGRKYFAVKLHLEPGKQYCLNWSAWTSRGATPIVLIQERPDGGAVYFAKELTNGRNRTGYFYAENPEPYAIIEMRGNGVTELARLSLKQRLDRSALFQDWRIQRFPAPAHLLDISRKQETPHFDFAPKLPGGTIRLFAVTSFWRQSLRHELEQRFDIRSEGMFTNGNAGKPIVFWAKDKNGLAYRKQEDNDILRAKSADCIYINACGASALTPLMVKTILQQVERGAGLVICAFEQPYYPYKDGRRKESVERLRNLFGEAFKMPATQDIDYVSISAATKLEALFGTYGKGRAVMLMDAQNVKGYERVFFEIQEALVGKAILWATNRVPTTCLKNVRQTESGLAFGMNATAGQTAKASIQLIDMRCREHQKAEQPAASGELQFPLELNGLGQFPVIVRLTENGKTLDWDVLLMERKGEGLFKELKVRKHAPILKGRVDLTRKPLEGETVDILVQDGFGALWKKWSRPAKSRIDFELPVEGIPAIGGILTFQLKSTTGKLLDQISADVTLSTGDDPENIDFNLGVWGVPMDTYTSGLYHKTLKEEYGLDFRLTGNHPRLPWQLQKMNIRSGPSGAPGQLYFGQKNTIKGDKLAPERVLCLSSNELKKDLAAKIRAITTPMIGIDAKYYFMDHETNLLGYINKAKPGSDYCFSPTCRASLAELAKSEYGTLEKLNAAWGTSFQKWEELSPIVLSEAIKTGNAARWIDHRRNMDKVWTDLLKFRIAELRKYNPNAMGYIQNLHSAYSSNDSFSGIDYEQMLQCELGAGAMPESYINAFSGFKNYTLNAQGGAMWYPFGGAVDIPALNSLRASKVIWQTILLGDSCCLYYLHNFNDHGDILFNDIFLVNPDMTLSPEGEMLAEHLRKMHQGIDRLVLSARADNTGIEMLYSRSSEHACTFWQAMVGKKCPAASKLNPRQQQFEFFVPAIEEAGRDFASTGSRLLKDGGLSKRGTRLLILPFAQSISPEDAREIRAFVEAGGCVVADFRPAIADQHGTLGTQGLLDDVFGVRQRATWEFCPRNATVSIGKWTFRHALVGEPLELTTAKARGTADGTPLFLENRFGKGRAVLLNFSSQEPAFHSLFEEWLDSCGIPRLFKAKIIARSWQTAHGRVADGQIQRKANGEAIAVQDKSDSEDAGERETQVYQNTSRPKLHRFVSGDASVIGYYACRRGFALGQGEMVVEFTLPKSGFVYDLIEEKALGHCSAWKTTMPLEGVKIYGILPFEAQAPILDTPKVDTMDGTRRVTFNLSLPKEASSIAYPVRITPIAPDGKPMKGYAKTITVRNAQAQITLLLPADAAPGEWQFTAREVFGGKTSKARCRL